MSLAVSDEEYSPYESVTRRDLSSRDASPRRRAPQPTAPHHRPTPPPPSGGDASTPSHIGTVHCRARNVARRPVHDVFSFLTLVWIQGFSQESCYDDVVLKNDNAFWTFCNYFSITKVENDNW